MKKIWLIIISIISFIGCSIANTPTSKVEEYLGKYQKLDSGINISYYNLSLEQNLKDDQKKLYQKLIEKQYKNLSYEIKEEIIDGENATVNTQIKVYDYKEIIDKYNKEDYDNISQYHDILLKALDKQKDKITYTIDFKLSKNNKDEWNLTNLSERDKQKLLGIN